MVARNTSTAVTMAAPRDRLDEALDGLENWYDKAIAGGAGFKSDAERQAYVDSLGDLEKHPMFARTAEDLEGHPLAEAIRQIKEGDLTLVELALTYKDEGNEWQRKKDKHSLSEAHDRYTHAMSYVFKAEAARRDGSEDPKDAAVDLSQLRSQILSNRAAVSLTLQNYGSCKRDCNLAIEAWFGNVKAHYRKCRALFLLKDFDACVRACADALLVDPSNKDIADLKDKSSAERQAAFDKQIRVLDAKYAELRQVWLRVWKLAQQTGASLGHYQLFNPEPLQVRDHWPQRDGEEISWPLVVLYPQHNQLDVVPDAGLDTMLAEQLAAMFPDFSEAPPAPWDTHREYEVTNLVVYLQVNLTEKTRSAEEWLLSCVESYVKMQSGSLEVAKYALRQLNLGQATHPRFGDLDELTLDKFNEIVEREAQLRTQRLHAQTLQEDSQLNPPASIYEVHMGCTLRRVLSFVPDANILPRGVLSLVVFPRGNAAHKKFLKAVKMDNRTIEVINPV